MNKQNSIDEILSSIQQAERMLTRERVDIGNIKNASVQLQQASNILEQLFAVEKYKLENK